MIEFQEKERQAAYGHRAPKGSVAKMLIEKEKEKNGKAVKEKRKTKKVEMEIELKQAEPKNFDTVLKKYSDKTMEKLMSEGRFDDLAALCAAVAHHCPVPHRNLLMTLSLAARLRVRVWLLYLKAVFQCKPICFGKFGKKAICIAG